MNYLHKKKANRLIEEFENSPSECLFIHYSRQNLDDNERGVATPRIIAICIKSLDGKLNEFYAIHLEAEKAKIPKDEIIDYYDLLEERVIKSFLQCVKKYRDCNWLHWNMNDAHFSFEAIEHRYKVLIESEGRDFITVPLNKRYNLSDIVQELYGEDFEKEPKFENLIKSNNGGITKSNYLTLSDEARVFEKNEYTKVIESLTCKINFFSEIINKASKKQLKVSNRNILQRLGGFTTHPVVAAITFVITVLSLILSFL